MNLEDPVMIYQARNNIELHQLSNMLTDAGIESYASDDETPGTFLLGWVPNETLIRAQMFVARKDAERAAELLRDYQDRLQARAPSAVEGRTEVNVQCPECHEPGWFPVAHLGTVQECPHCGKFMDVETEPDPDEDWGEPEKDEPTE